MPEALTPLTFDVRVNASRGPATEYMCITFGVDSSLLFFWNTDTQTHTQSHRCHWPSYHVSATGDNGKL